AVIVQLRPVGVVERVVPVATATRRPRRGELHLGRGRPVDGAGVVRETELRVGAVGLGEVAGHSARVGDQRRHRAVRGAVGADADRSELGVDVVGKVPGPLDDADAVEAGTAVEGAGRNGDAAGGAGQRLRPGRVEDRSESGVPVAHAGYGDGRV